MLTHIFCQWNFLDPLATKTVNAKQERAFEQVFRQILSAFRNFSTWTSRGYAQVKRRPQHVIAVLIGRELASGSPCRDSSAPRSGCVPRPCH